MDWTVRLARPEEIPQVIHLYNSLFPKTGKTDSWWNWWYESNPAGQGAAMVAVDIQGQVGAVLCMTPVRLNVDGQTVLVAQDSVGLVHPDAQRQGLFGRVAKALHEWEARKFDFQFCFCNEKSKWAYIKHINFIDQGASAFYTGEAISRRLPDDAVVREIYSFGPDHDALWDLVRARCRIVQIRDARYLNWRFAPGGTGKKYKIFDVFLSGSLHGTLVVQQYQDKLDLLDYLWRSGDGLGDLNEVLDAAQWIAASLGIRKLSFFCLKAHDRFATVLANRGYRREERDFHLLSRWLNERHPGVSLDNFSLWEYTAGDLELF